MDIITYNILQPCMHVAMLVLPHKILFVAFLSRVLTACVAVMYLLKCVIKIILENGDVDISIGSCGLHKWLLVITHSNKISVILAV